MLSVDTGLNSRVARRRHTSREVTLQNPGACQGMVGHEHLLFLLITHSREPPGTDMNL